MTIERNQNSNNNPIEQGQSADGELENSLRQIPQFDVPEQLLASLLDGIPDVAGEANHPDLVNPVLVTDRTVVANWRWLACISVAASLLLLAVTWVTTPKTDEAVGKAVAESPTPVTDQPDAASNSIALFRETDPCNILPPFSK